MKFDRGLEKFTIICAAIGLVDSVYLTWIKLTHTTALCLPGIGDCETVNTSRYSEINGIPIALLGALVYLAILLIILLKDKASFLGEYGLYLLFGISLVGVLYSAYLTYIEIAVIHAICPFCVISAIVILLIFVSTIVRLSQDQGSQKS
ncbi:MAG TPA: vitamin K epoxide reductase family protein [Anaerolinea sp.]|nr:vitamin K epoxide reductase family protein [Anaerolinea sp.]